jgi:hypothetical protein
VDRALERAHPHEPGRFVAEGAQLGLDGVHVVQDRPGPPRQDQPGRREPDPAAGAF